MNPNSSVLVRFDCGRGHDLHPLCVDVGRGVPPELRCERGQSTGVASGGGGCPLPSDYAERADRELRDNLQESKRRGYVLIRV